MSSTPSASPQPPTVPPAAPPPKSSNKVIFWVLGIFGGLVLFVILVVVGLGFFVAHKVKQAGFDSELANKNPGYVAAKMMVAMNPDLSITKSDDSTGTITVYNKKDGKTVTMRFDAQKKTMVITDENGKEAVKFSGDGNSANVEVNGPQGSVKIGSGADGPPSWVPVYPGAATQNTMSINENGKQSGGYVFVTQDSADKVLTYYTDALKSAGLTASTTTFNTNGKVGGSVTGEDNGRAVGVMVASDNDGTHVTVTFGEKKAAQ